VSRRLFLLGLGSLLAAAVLLAVVVSLILPRGHGRRQGGPRQPPRPAPVDGPPNVGPMLRPFGAETKALGQQLARRPAASLIGRLLPRP
jgi:hypothetical protein